MDLTGLLSKKTNIAIAAMVLLSSKRQTRETAVGIIIIATVAVVAQAVIDTIKTLTEGKKS